MTEPQDNAKPPILKIALVGPECTGKTELATFLSGHFQTLWVPEYARSYLDQLPLPYEEADLLHIAQGQLQQEDKLLPQANRLLICDTTLLVVKIWSEFVYGHCDPKILQLHATRTYDLYLLTYIDIAWEDDPQREHPTRRTELWDIYQHELKQMNVPWVDIRGDRSSRQDQAIMAIQNMIESR